MQSAYHDIDTYCLPARDHLMLKTIVNFHELAREMLDSGTTVAEIRSSPILYKISRMKDIPHDVFEQRIEELRAEMAVSFVAHKGGA